MTGASPYGLGIFPQHAALLEASAVSPDVARERGYVSVDTKTRLDGPGFSAPQRRVPGLLIPIHGVTGTVATWQYRPDVPRVTRAGRGVKYETPAGTRMLLDVPPRVRPQLGDPKIPLWLTEGARKADAAVTAGLACIAVLGVWNWRGTNPAGGTVALADWESVALNGRRVYVAFDSDAMTKDSVHVALSRLAAFLTARKADVLICYLPELTAGTKTGLDDYLAAGKDPRDLAAAARSQTRLSQAELPPALAAAPPSPRKLADVEAAFAKWLHFDDPIPLYALAAVLAANRAPGDPVWLLIVAAPSTGKTELLSAASRLPWVHAASTITASSLLSGTSLKERAKDATGGLLRQVGDFGVILAKDFTSLLAQNKDTRAEALAALRETYDGRWDRAVGTDGGKMLTWRGKCGLIGGVTPALDRYHSVVSALGDRFLLLRLADPDPALSGRMALTHRGHEQEMRAELQESLAGLVEHADIGCVNRELSDDEQHWLIRIASYTARARTAVERDGYQQEILYLPQVEGPGRLVNAYARLLGGLEAIGCEPPIARRALIRVALDCAPATRTAVISQLLSHHEPVRTSAVAGAVGMATKTAHRYLEDLSLLGVASRAKANGSGNSPDYWSATSWLREHWPQGTTEKNPPSPYLPIGEGDVADAITW